MHLTPREQEKLLTYLAGKLASERLGRGLRLNYPEATALIASFIQEGARDGKSVAELMQAGAQVLTADDVMSGVPEMIDEVQVEATFRDGTKLVTVHNPIGHRSGVEPGEYLLDGAEIGINQGRRTAALNVTNTGDRPVQVGSHFHFFEVNKALDFDRSSAFGMRLDIPAGTAVRFEPGEEIKVNLVELGGKKAVQGLSGLTRGSTRGPARRERSLKLAREKGFKGADRK